MSKFNGYRSTRHHYSSEQRWEMQNNIETSNVETSNVWPFSEYFKFIIFHRPKMFSLLSKVFRRDLWSLAREFLFLEDWITQEKSDYPTCRAVTEPSAITFLARHRRQWALAPSWVFCKPRPHGGIQFFRLSIQRCWFNCTQAGDPGRVPYLVNSPDDLKDVLSCFPSCEVGADRSLLS
jgi:hypothetical protein